MEFSALLLDDEFELLDATLVELDSVAVLLLELVLFDVWEDRDCILFSPSFIALLALVITEFVLSWVTNCFNEFTASCIWLIESLVFIVEIEFDINSSSFEAIVDFVHLIHLFDFDIHFV